jgi:hypothetical protein
MSVFYGRNAAQVNLYGVNSVSTTGGTILSQGNDADGGYFIQFQHDLAGCGGPDSGIYIELKDTTSNWTWISCRFQLSGSASCWSFSNNVGLGNYGAAVGVSGTANLLAYDPASGDKLSNGYLSYEDAQFASHNPTYACDNDANNFMRYNTGIFRRFTMTRRRNVGAGLAGIHHGRSCNSTGGGSVTIIDQIRIW